MADTPESGAPGTQPGAGNTVRCQAAKEVPAATRSEMGAVQERAQAVADTADEVGRRDGEAVRAGDDATAEALRQVGEAAERSDEAVGEAARHDMQTAAEQRSRFVKGAAEEVEKTGRSLAGMVEEAATGMRSLMGGPGSNARGLDDAQQALSGLVQGVMETNMRFADELLRRTGPGTVVELQQRFLREYFDALAQGGTLLLRAARQAAEESSRPLEEGMRKDGAGGGDACFAEKGDRARGRGSKVADVMSKDVKLASPEDTVQEAARAMSEQDTGALPVGENGRLIGMVTERDLTVRAVAAGKDPAKTKLREVMSGEPRYVFEDESVERAAASMTEQQVQRLPVLNRDKQLVGILSLGDLAPEADRGVVGEALAGVSRSGGQPTRSGPDMG